MKRIQTNVRDSERQFFAGFKKTIADAVGVVVSSFSPHMRPPGVPLLCCRHTKGHAFAPSAIIKQLTKRCQIEGDTFLIHFIKLQMELFHF